jgi:hypothetical protein
MGAVRMKSGKVRLGKPEGIVKGTSWCYEAFLYRKALGKGDWSFRKGEKTEILDQTRE